MSERSGGAPPRVLQLLGPSTGGIRRHVAHLTDVLCRDGWTVDVAGPDGVLDDLDHVVPVPDGIDVRALLRSRRALQRILPDYDLLHAHGLKAGWTASLSRRVGLPLVVSVHNLVLDEAAGRSAPVLRRLEGMLPARAHRTIAVSGEVAGRFDGLDGSDRIVVIPPTGPPPAPSRSAAAVRADLSVADGDDLVVSASRLHPQKDLDLLLDVAALVVRRRPRLRWFVFGEGPLHDRLAAEVTRRDLVDVVHLAGARPNVDDELAAADVVAVTSRWESGPLVVLEALALGRPIVSTGVGLVPDVVHPPNGRVVDVGDASAFADALVDLLETGPQSTSSSAADELHPDALARRVGETYREVLGHS